MWYIKRPVEGHTKNYSLVIKFWPMVSSDITWFQKPGIKFQTVSYSGWHGCMALDIGFVSGPETWWGWHQSLYCLLLHFFQVSIHMSSSHWCFSEIPYWKLLPLFYACTSYLHILLCGFWVPESSTDFQNNLTWAFLLAQFRLGWENNENPYSNIASWRWDCPLFYLPDLTSFIPVSLSALNKETFGLFSSWEWGKEIEKDSFASWLVISPHGAS